MTWALAYKIAHHVEVTRAQTEAGRRSYASWSHLYDPLAVVTLAELIKEGKR